MHWVRPCFSEFSSKCYQFNSGLFLNSLSSKCLVANASVLRLTPRGRYSRERFADGWNSGGWGRWLACLRALEAGGPGWSEDVTGEDSVTVVGGAGSGVGRACAAKCRGLGLG